MKLQVMLVDDEQYVRKGLLGLIDWDSLGYSVSHEADNGKDALRIITSRQSDIDVVITDIRMPVMDGLKLIEEVKLHNLSTCKFIILSGYNDFSYAQSAIRYGVSDYILKPIEEEDLEETLRKLALEIKEVRLQKAISGRLTLRGLFEQLSRGEQAAKAVTELDERVRLSKGSVLRYGIVEMNRSLSEEGDATDYLIKDDVSVVAQALQTLVDVPIDDFVVQLRNHQCAFLICSDALKLYGGSYEQFGAALQNLLAKRLQAGVTLYFGTSVKEMKMLSTSIQTANELLQYKYVKGMKDVLFYETASKTKLSYAEPDVSLFHRIQEAVEEQETEKIKTTIATLFAEIETKSLAKDAIRTIINRYVHRIVGTLQGMQGPTDLLVNLKPMLSWDAQPLSFSQLQHLFISFMIESSRMMEQLRGEQTKGSIHKIKSYIEHHYQENINLKSIAAEFYMNPVYVGQLFKKTYGQYFNEFLLSIRIGEAKKLLRQTDFRIYEIAEKVGFNNADYFVAQFEKMEDMPPSEYRKKLLTKQGGHTHENATIPTK
ncbi:response regulator transcription factor [Paenibacillus sp. LjRoot56]|uniref:response regulator transcription factor n=1 Tax=Paenibacillus sp. LjRoot56 TaxID=3342333 RepID=UPI003ED0F8F3